MPAATEILIPSSICPACGAIDPATERVEIPALTCYATGYDEDGSGYRCLECNQVSESEDWERLAADICCECGKVGTKQCVCPRGEEDALEMARRRGPTFELPVDFKFITVFEKEVA